MWIYLLRHGAGKGHSAGEEAWRWKKRAWRWEKGAWRGAMLKGAGGNTICNIQKMDIFSGDVIALFLPPLSVGINS